MYLNLTLKVPNLPTAASLARLFTKSDTPAWIPGRSCDDVICDRSVRYSVCVFIVDMSRFLPSYQTTISDHDMSHEISGFGTVSNT